MENITPQTPLCNLTVKEFLEISKNLNSENMYEYGLKVWQKFWAVPFQKHPRLNLQEFWMKPSFRKETSSSSTRKRL